MNEIRLGRYVFKRYADIFNLPNKGCVYIISKLKNNDSKISYEHIYVGEEDDLDASYREHSKKKCFIENGADTVFCLLESSKEKRESIVKEITTVKKLPCTP